MKTCFRKDERNHYKKIASCEVYEVLEAQKEPVHSSKPKYSMKLTTMSLFNPFQLVNLQRSHHTDY